MYSIGASSLAATANAATDTGVVAANGTLSSWSYHMWKYRLHVRIAAKKMKMTLGPKLVEKQ